MDRETRSRCESYATELYAGESATQAWVRAEMARREMPLIQVSALEGRILAVVAAVAGARRVLEVGTLGGYSGLWLLSLLPPEAELVTVEREAAHAELAAAAFRRAGVEERVELRRGDAADVLAELAAAVSDGAPAFDMVFLDADKESYPGYLDLVPRLLAAGGVVAADNVFWGGRVLDPAAAEATTRGIRAFNRRLAEDPRFEAAVIPVRDGLAVARFRG